MKYVLMLILVVVIILIAKGVARQYIERYELYVALKDFFKQMELNLGFQKHKIKEILNKSNIKKVNKDIYTNYFNYLTEGNDLDLRFVKLLDSTEQEYITNMLLSLGKSDTLSEIKQLQVYEQYLNDKVITTKQEKDKCCPLIVKLSFLFALGLVILLI